MTELEELRAENAELRKSIAWLKPQERMGEHLGTVHIAERKDIKGGVRIYSPDYPLFLLSLMDEKEASRSIIPSIRAQHIHSKINERRNG